MTIPFTRSLRGNRGFTLVELLVVIAIIGILATLLLLQLNQARAKGRDAKRISDISQLRTALELYYNDYGYNYPIALDASSLGAYMATGNVPTDPSTGVAYGYSWDPLVNPTRFHLYAELETNNASAFSTDADIDSTGFAGGGAARVDADPTTTEGSGNCDSATPLDCLYDVGQDQ